MRSPSIKSRNLAILGLVQKKYKSGKGESMGKPEKKLKRILMILGITGAVYGAFRFLLPLVIPFLLSWGLAVLLRPSAKKISEVCRIPIGIVGMAECAVLIVLAGMGIYMVGRKLCAEASLLVDAIPVWIEKLDSWLTGGCHRLEVGLSLPDECLVRLMREMLRDVMRSIRVGAMPYLMSNSVSVFQCMMGIAVLAVLIFISSGLALKELPVWKKRIRRSFLAEEAALIGARLSLVVRAYFKTQFVIITLIALLCMLVFWFMKNPYYILAGIAVGILDALPILGTGTVLIPWAVLLLVRRQWERGLLLLLLYVICYFLREYLEARWMGEQVGLSPLENLIAIYVGLQLFGIWGVVLGPIGVLVIGDLTELWCREEPENQTTGFRP